MLGQAEAAQLREMSDAIRASMASGDYPFDAVLADAHGKTARLADGRPVVLLSSNNYLGLSLDPRVIAAAHRSLDDFGLSTCGARFQNGTTTEHCRLEEELAAWLGYDGAIVFNSGYQANVGALQAVGGPGTVFIVDQLDHESIVEGVVQGGGVKRIFGHNDLAKLEYILQQTQTFDRRIVVVEGVYSMDGDVAPLDRIDQLCRQYQAWLMVDDAHGIGVMGESGRGSCERHGVVPDVLMGTLSKAFGAVGGFLVGSRPVIDFIRHNARAFIFNAAPPPLLMSGAVAALRIIQTEPQLRERLWRNTVRFRQGLLDLGLDTGVSVTPIVPVRVGSERAALGIAQDIRDEGFFLSSAVFPAVPKGQSRLRTTVTALLTEDDIDRATAAIGRRAERHR